MKILVTGHRGKLGSRVSALLTEAEHEVVGYDLRDGQDVTDTDALEAAAEGCEVIVHLAGLPHPNKGDLTRYFRVNVRGTLNVLQAARVNGVGRVVYSSSTGYYGCDVKGTWTPLRLPVTEDHPPLPVNPQFDGALCAYNTSKVMAEQLLAWYATNGIVQAIVLRIAPANTKAEQYPNGDKTDFANATDWRRGALFANCHPDYAAEALARAAVVEVAGNYHVCNVVDKYPPAGLGLSAYDFGVSYRNKTDARYTPFYTRAAAVLLDWEACKDR